MLNLTDHLRRLRVDKYEYVAMKVIVLLQSGMVNGFINEHVSISLQFLIWKKNPFLICNRYVWFAWAGTSAWMSRESIACFANIHACPLPRCAIKIRWTAIKNTGATANLSGKMLENSFNKWITAQIQHFTRFHSSIFFFWQIGKEMLTIKSKDGAEFNLLLELLRGEHWQFLFSNIQRNKSIF